MLALLNQFVTEIQRHISAKKHHLRAVKVSFRKKHAVFVKEEAWHIKQLALNAKATQGAITQHSHSLVNIDIINVSCIA